MAAWATRLPTPAPRSSRDNQHWLSDFAECEGWIGMYQDIHISCKVGYAFLM